MPVVAVTNHVSMATMADEAIGFDVNQEDIGKKIG
jgi:hypothetical protein